MTIQLSIQTACRYVAVNFLLIFSVISLSCCQPPLSTETTTVTPKPTVPPAINHQKKPPKTEWPLTYERRNVNKYILGEWSLTGSWGIPKINFTRGQHEYEGYDGFYNNIARPDSGAIDKPLLRRWPAAYEDGTYAPSGRNRPNPLESSEKLSRGEIGTHSRTGKNALLVFFGQQVVEEILDSQRPACPPEYFNIDIPAWHNFTKLPGHTQLPVLRTRYDQRTGLNPNNPRQQSNEITPYIDGGLFYGITKQWADSLRTDENGSIHPNGSLASSHGGLFPGYNYDRLPMANPPPPFHHEIYIKKHETEEVSRFFKLGNPRGNENSFLSTFGIMWFRWHNYIAESIKKSQPAWSSEEIFNEARKWVIATQQHIYVDEWLPALSSKNLENYTGYDPSVNPQIDQFFQAAAFRFGHTSVTPGVYLRDYIRNGCKHRFDTWKNAAVRTCNIFWRPQDPILKPEAENSGNVIDIDRLLMGMSVQLCEEEDHRIVEDLRGNVFGPLEFPRRDLMAINVQRGRDHGLPGFNDARKAFGLPPVDINHFNHLPNITRQELMRLYNGSIDDVDVWIGGILETRDGPGELFETIIMDQFRRIRNGDRFWFENKKNGMFSQSDIDRIKELRVYDIIMAVTKMDSDDIPEFAFAVPSSSRNMDKDSPLVKNCSLEVKKCGFMKQTPFDCWHLPYLTQSVLGEPCKQGYSYDYFSNSAISYIATFTAIGAFVIGCFSAIYLLVLQKRRMLIHYTQKLTNATRKSVNHNTGGMHSTIFGAQEWISKKQPVRTVGVIFDSVNKQIRITCQKGNSLRAIDLAFANVFKIYSVTDMPYSIVNSRHSYDLVLQFPTIKERNEFNKELQVFIKKFELEHEEISIFKWKDALNIITTKKDRQKKLEKFYRVVFAQAFKINHSKNEILSVSSNDKDIINTEITMMEFAESLNMKPDNEFVKRMFYLTDKDRNGFISFREFVGLLIIFAEGSDKEKAQLLFKMYDIDDTGVSKAEDFESMIRCFLESVGGNIPEDKSKQTIHGMLSRAHCENKSELELQDFLKILGRDIVNLNKAKLGFKGFEDDGSYLSTARNTIENIYGTLDINTRFKGEASQHNDDTYMYNIIDQEQKKILENKENIKNSSHDNTLLSMCSKYIELRSKEIFWLSLYTLILWLIFLERAYYYSFEREHSGLRRIAGYGVTITRGAASAQMFTYSSLLVTMCRNTITTLRDTVANKYFPFDSSVEIHKYIAWWAFFFTVLHIIGHAFNFYHISTQTADDLTCLFRNYFHATHESPKFHYWCWQTMTGITGVVSTLIWITMYVFALSYVRSKIYNWFWYTHSLYPLFFIFMILHGTGRLIQEPFFYYFFSGPVILFTIDSLISISRKKIEIPVVKADVLPSHVTMSEFQKPDNFQYKSGQWVRIACMALNKNEYHPFTLTSSPNEDTSKLHIRSVGPWTTHIRTIYEEANNSGNIKLPKIYLDGPYGEGHQDWNNYDVSISIGGGIGVTPFASILKDIAYRSGQTRCKKVYFLWVSRTQKQFEWLIDIIREVEYKDTKNIISCHIFITQFFEKFDLRMILSYVMERHYQRVANRSLFTNLKAVSHFGRPSFAKIFKTVQTLHAHTPRIGVFSCGPPSMTSSVNAACFALNFEGYHRFEHHYKNF